MSSSSATPTTPGSVFCDPTKVKKDEWVSVTNYFKVVGQRGDMTIITHAKRGGITTNIGHRVISTSAHSSDQFSEVKEVTETELVRILIHETREQVFSCCFIKLDGTERVIICYRTADNSETAMGRSKVHDLNIEGYNIRQIDHRNILWIIFKGVKYVNKKKKGAKKPKPKPKAGKAAPRKRSGVKKRDDPKAKKKVAKKK